MRPSRFCWQLAKLGKSRFAFKFFDGEYGMGAKLSALGDIYSFGILTLEIFTGKRPTDTCFQENFSLHHFVKRTLPKGEMELLDRTALDCEMPGKVENGEECWANLNKERVECLVDILEIGVACSAESPRDRLTMRQVYKLTNNSPEIESVDSSPAGAVVYSKGVAVRSLTSDLGHYFPNLQRLYLGNCQFIGSIPSSLANASKLLHLDFPENNFTGNIPKGFGNLQNLLWLNVLSNHLGYGKNDDLDFVSSLTNCSSLQMLHFRDNLFGGTLPHSTTNLSSQLRRLLLGGNRIGGSIPKDISNLVNLNVLYMGYNNFTGSIPDIGRLTNLGSLNLGNNLLTGVIPSSIGNLTKLMYLYLGLNRLEGNIPSTFGNCNQLLRLDISDNKLTGTIPQLLIALSSLTKIYAYYNSLTGPLPLYIGNWSHLTYLDFSYNNFSGMIPRTLGKCLTLGEIYMKGNSLQRTVPDLEDLQDLQSLDLSLNNLSGPIPHFIANLNSLLYLNLSFNNLEGEVPLTGIFSNVSADVFLGNSKLCGGIQGLFTTLCLQETQKTRKKHVLALKFILTIVFAASFSILALLVGFLCWRRNWKDQPEPEDSTMGNLRAKNPWSAIKIFSKRFYRGFSERIAVDVRIVKTGFDPEILALTSN
ncbi:hypothetical protein K7X08_024774 [Anisodus acutangulus]|uniref:Disease resistance R13L4/SHOC-2-like LRR domain-containing protein n=1 Tax=Anisodus acutangulus TaxID=402998 RepID=A0A9Q1MBS6_9SOLA|nr:hypothetical protein K7X08_024774 [Anisodus acutangulus]